MTDERMQPIFVLPPESSRTSGREAQRANIQAAKTVADAVRTTLGPKGMDKMLVNASGEITVTNDGVTILDEMAVEHPCAKMIVDVARTQEATAGDGTTTAVVLAGELLLQAEHLLEQGVHPTIIARGYMMAAAEAQRHLEATGSRVSLEDTKLLTNLATTAMTGKGAENSREHLAALVVEAAQMIAQKNPRGNSLATTFTLHREGVQLLLLSGGTVEDTTLIDGVVLERENFDAAPVALEKPTIALLNTALEVRTTEVDSQINIADPQQLQAFLDMEDRMLRKMVDVVAASGATMVCCQKGIDDIAMHLLAEKGILALRRIPQNTMTQLVKATGASVVSSPKDLAKKHLGAAGRIVERSIAGKTLLFVEECPHARAVTVLVRGGTPHVLAETKRALDDAIGDVASALRAGKLVAGAGAPEADTAVALRKHARTMKGKEQLAIHAFADSLEVIPRTLSENSGSDPVDTVASVRTAHERGRKWIGVDVANGGVLDARKAGVLEPLSVKLQAIASAADVAVMILRIDDVIAAGRESNA